MLFFSCYLFTFSRTLNFYMTSPKRSVAPSGGFSFSGLAFFLLSLPLFYSFTSLGLLLVSTFEFELGEIYELGSALAPELSILEGWSIELPFG